MRLFFLALIALILPACGRSDERAAGGAAVPPGSTTAVPVPPGGAVAPGTVAPPPSAGAPAPADSGAPGAGAPTSAEGGSSTLGIPMTVLVRRNACPFECCTYRDWTAETAIPVKSGPRDDGAPVFTLAKGETFRADSGSLYVTGIGRVVVRDTTDIGQGRPPLLPGDTLILLEPIGEGYFNVWKDGRVLRDVPGFWDPGYRPRTGALLGHYAREWWVHVTTHAGRQGWFRADTTYDYSGADRCA